eukprot:6187310-Pleurochrysis_carterae.AAC.2
MPSAALPLSVAFPLVTTFSITIESTACERDDRPLAPVECVCRSARPLVMRRNVESAQETRWRDRPTTCTPRSTSSRKRSGTR